MSEENKDTNKTQYTITGCDLWWCSLKDVNKFSGKFQVNAANLSAKDVKALEAMGIKVQDGKEKGKPEMGKYIVAKAQRPVMVIDSQKNTIADPSKVGNESKGSVSVNAYNYDHPTGGKGVGCGLQAVQVNELKEYSPTAMFEVVEGGYTEAEPVAEVEDPVPNR